VTARLSMKCNISWQAGRGGRSTAGTPKFVPSTTTVVTPRVRLSEVVSIGRCLAFSRPICWY